PRRRWYASGEAGVSGVRFLYAVPFCSASRIGDGQVLLSEIEVRSNSGAETYQLPLGFIGEDDASVLSVNLAMARIRHGREVGLLTDAFTRERFVRAALDNLRAESRIETEAGVVEFSCYTSLDDLGLEAEPEITWLSAEQSNSSVIIGDK